MILGMRVIWSLSRSSMVLIYHIRKSFIRVRIPV